MRNPTQWMGADAQRETALKRATRQRRARAPERAARRGAAA